eukprot:8838707-Pyramimonas_sp.AAC.1
MALARNHLAEQQVDLPPTRGNRRERGSRHSLLHHAPAPLALPVKMRRVGRYDLEIDAAVFTASREALSELGTAVGENHLGKPEQADPPQGKLCPDGHRAIVLEKTALMAAGAVIHHAQNWKALALELQVEEIDREQAIESARSRQASPPSP